MVLQQIRIGSAVDVFQYDDADFDSAIEVTAPIKSTAPVDPTDVLRLEDLIGLAFATLTTAVVGPTDNLDVAGVNVVFLDCSANDVTIGGFIGGVDGQVLHIARLCAGAFTATLEHAEGGGSQDIFLHAGADESLFTEYGGWILVCNGTSWFDLSHSKHV